MTKPRVYFDACCFIDLIKHGRGKNPAPQDDETKARMQDVWFMSQLCDAAKDGHIELITSALTVAECTHIGEIPPDTETKELFERFLMSGRVVTLIEPSVFVAQDARNLGWNHGVHVKGADAIHFATAIGEKCSEFITTDARIIKQSSKKLTAAIPLIEKLGVAVIRASATSALPNEYRQGDMLHDKTMLH